MFTNTNKQNRSATITYFKFFSIFILSFLRHTCKVIKRRATRSMLTNVKQNTKVKLPQGLGERFSCTGKSAHYFSLDKFPVSLAVKISELLLFLPHSGWVPDWEDVPISDLYHVTDSNVHGQKVQRRKKKRKKKPTYHLFCCNRLCPSSLLLPPCFSENKGSKIWVISLVLSVEFLR